MPTDDLLELAMQDMLAADDDTLLEKLGMGVSANIAQQPEVVQYAPQLTYEVAVMGPLDELRTLGRRVLARWSRELYKVMCGDLEADKKDRDSLLKALGVSDVAIGAALTALLVTWGVAAAIATVIAALVVKSIIIPAGSEACEYWGERLRGV
ncbi:hypothetical protein WK60_00315 [Burkholderia ubonensis]|uniref:hypothetical protein n=1 Tax=Burkholderia ubonensis TaxID=101571 RepID=UPI000753F7C6|nr:hypothetical protein [Burkholderia ubonensis]KVT98533.1 hypothetical protein WK60_00315 [Burkholderia ubonensis]